jgi:NAD(P)-dependent dehydrogenase (short-subunit alcohol dehydrogenase family)
MANRFCVVGATRGTGLQIALQLLQRGMPVRALARDPDKARRLLGDRAQVYGADVTLPDSLRGALDADCQAVFFAVDVTGGIGGRSFFGSKQVIRDVTYQGLVNVVQAARSSGFAGRIVLLSGMGADQPSFAGRVLNLLKGNLQQNQVDREDFLKNCGLDYTVGRGAILTDAAGDKHRTSVSAPVHTLDFLRTLARADFARVLIVASELTGASRKVFDVFNEPGGPTDDAQIARQLRAVPEAHGAASQGAR